MGQIPPHELAEVRLVVVVVQHGVGVIGVVGVCIGVGKVMGQLAQGVVLPDGPPPAALELLNPGVDVGPGVVVVVPLELVVANGPFQVAEGVHVRLKRAEEESQFKAPGGEAHFTAKQRPGQQGVGSFLQS